MQTIRGKTILTLVLFLAGSLVIAQQPPAKTGTPPPQPPGKTVAPGQPPAETGTPAVNAAPGSVEQIVTFTYDGVRLEGDYYPAPEGKAKVTPCLILVHPVGPKHLTSSRADFGKLPEKLQKMGYAVVAIDLRGYGKSKTVEPKFWNFHTPKSKSINTIEGKDYASSLELLEMVYDLTAVKIWLNLYKNNAKECNSHVIGVIGLEQGGLIAMAWAANELSDPARIKNQSSIAALNAQNNNGFANGQGNANQGIAGGIIGGFFGGNRNNNNMNNNQNNTGLGTNIIPKYEGEDITCIVSVSTTNRLNDPLSYALLERWISFLRDRGVASMAIYGANDKEASAFWSKAALWAKPTTDKYRFKNSGAKPIKNTSLVGAKLLSNDALDVTKVLEEYLAEAVKRTGESRLWSEQTGPEKPSPFEVQRLFR
jgi:hypothetical protein